MTTPPTYGDFRWYPHLEEFEKEGLKDMFDAITKLNLWVWLQNFEITPKLGFRFDDAPEITTISKETAYVGYSGASFGWCMVNMQMIAKFGWSQYYITIIEQNK